MSILSPQDKEELFAKLSELGEEKVRENLASKIYGSNKIALVNEWLRKQEENQYQEKSDLETSFIEQELSEAKQANRLAREANEFAREAISVSREQASAAARSALWAAIAAIIAAIAAIVGPIITAWLTKK